MKISTNHKRYLFSNVVKSLYFTGLLKSYAFYRLRRKALILMYHRVLPQGEIPNSNSQPSIIVNTQNFEMQAYFLKRNFKVLSLGEFIHRLQNRTPFEDRSCLITFDDGWRDNFTHALPILKKHQLPAVVFLSSGFIGSPKRFWQEKLAELIGRMDKSRISLEALLASLPRLRNIACSLPDRRLHGCEDIFRAIAELKKYDQSKIDEFLEELERLASAPADGASDQRVFLSWKEVREMSDNRIDFGSHTVNHLILTANRDKTAEEIYSSKAEIEKHLGREISAFTYPNGEYCGAVVKMVKDCGYKAAFTTRPGFVTSEDDPFELNRCNVHDFISNSMPLFLALVGRITSNIMRPPKRRHV